MDSDVRSCLDSIAGNVRQLRDRHGWTQEQLAEKADIEARYVQEIERARTNLSIAILVAVARALGVDPRRLLKPAMVTPARPGRPPTKKKAKPRKKAKKRATK